MEKCAGFGLYRTPDTSPTAEKSVTIDEPPYEKKGSGMPITGVMPMHMPMLMKVWKASAPATPMQMSISYIRPACSPTYTQRTMMIVSRMMTTMQPIIPRFSPMLANTKSVCLPVNTVAR